MLFGGHVADRRERRAIVVLTSAVARPVRDRRSPALAAAGATLLGILAVIFVTGIASGFERPALTALEAQVVPREQAAAGVSSLEQRQPGRGDPRARRPAASRSRSSASRRPTRVIAVLLVASHGMPRAISPKPVPPPVEGEPFLESLLGGIRYVSRTPALIGSMALDLFAVFFGGAIALLPIFATDILHVGPVGLGVLRTAPSLGALLVMLIATRRPPSRPCRTDPADLRGRLRGQHDRLRAVDDLLALARRAVRVAA